MDLGLPEQVLEEGHTIMCHVLRSRNALAHTAMVWSGKVLAHAKDEHIHIHTCTYAYPYAYTYTYAYAYIYTYIYIYT